MKPFNLRISLFVCLWNMVSVQNVDGSGNSVFPNHVWKLVLSEVRLFLELSAEIGRTVRVLCVCVACQQLTFSFHLS
jgi:hypothetical protein